MSEEAFQKMVERQVEILQKERSKTVCPPTTEEFTKVHGEQLEQNEAIPSVEDDSSSSCVVPSSTTDDSSNMETEVHYILNIVLVVIFILLFSKKMNIK